MASLTTVTLRLAVECVSHANTGPKQPLYLTQGDCSFKSSMYTHILLSEAIICNDLERAHLRYSGCFIQPHIAYKQYNQRH